MPGVDLTFGNSTLQNGPDAVAIFSATVDDYPLPEPKEANEPDGVLFDSARTYADQLIPYKTYRTATIRWLASSSTRPCINKPRPLYRRSRGFFAVIQCASRPDARW